MFFLDHIWLIPLFPAIGAVCMFFFGRKLSKSAVNGICVGVVVLAFAWACLAVWQYTGYSAANPGKPFEKVLYTWLGTGDNSLSYVTHDGTAEFHADAGFLLDPLSSIWLLFVTGVGMLIHIYSMGYMAHEGGYYRFFGYMNLFMFSMLTLILANNYALMFVGWEGVGLCSYLLIGFYFQRHSASTAANKAFIVNRIGDAGFMLGMFTIAWYFGSMQYTKVNLLARSGQFHIGDPVITAACLLLFVGACGKSAQFPLYVWLPDAMEGPTPVSALIHAATMVTAGVYMVARSNALFVLAPNAMKTVAIIGALTAIFAATIGLVQNDIKRVLAYSTVSQLGYMFLALGVGAFAAGVFHVFTHAFFKALLFLGAGSVIHAMSGEQEMQHMGALHNKIKTTFGTMLIGTLAIAGIPGFRGLLLQGRHPVGDVVARSRRVSLPVVHRLPHRADDLVLHVPADLPDLRRQAAHESRGRAPHSRVAQVDDGAAGHPGDLRDWRGIPRIAAQPGRLQPLREVPGAGLRQGSGRAGRRRQSGAGRGRRAAGRAHRSHGVRADVRLGGRGASGLVAGAARLQERRQGLQGADRRGFAALLQDALPQVVRGRNLRLDLHRPQEGRRRCAWARWASATRSWKFDADVIDGAVNGAGWTTRMSGTLSVLWDKWIIDGLLVNGAPGRWCTRSWRRYPGAPGAVGPGAVVRAGDGFGVAA